MDCAVACAYGGGTIINAIATGHGAAFPISLKIVAKVCKSDTTEVRTYSQVDIAPIRQIVERVGQEFKVGPLSVEFSGDLPTAGV